MKKAPKIGSVVWYARSRFDPWHLFSMPKAKKYVVRSYDKEVKGLVWMYPYGGYKKDAVRGVVAKVFKTRKEAVADAIARVREQAECCLHDAEAMIEMMERRAKVCRETLKKLEC